MENISLFKIQQEFIDLCGQISEGSGELTPELEEKLKINAENFTEKTVNYHLFMKEIKMKIEQGKILKQEIDAKIKAFEKVFEKCENNVKGAMLLYEKETAGDDYHKFSLRKSVSVEIENENIIPAEYLKVITETKPDKIEIKNALKSGKEVAGCVLKTNNNLQM